MSTGGIPDLLTGALILIVDDEPANLQLLADLLKQRGHEVRVAPSGQLALNYIGRQKPDLILLDVNMPEMDGYEVCRRLKDNPDWAMIPVIFISASDEERNIVQSFVAGGVDYVTKPFHSAEVEARVETHLKLYRYQQHLEALVQEKVREAANAIERAAALQRIGIMGVISTGIAHEINQPLNALKMRADSLLYWENQRNLPPVAEIMQDVRAISQCADQIGEIIQHMRALAREQKPDRSAVCEVVATTRNILQLLEYRLARQHIVAQLEVCNPPPQVMMATVHWEQILINLVVNAYEALGRIERTHKQIRICLSAAGSDLLLEVADNGPGIKPADRAKIFEPFHTTGRTENNTGLGLPIIKAMIELYDGKIWLADNAAAGARFLVQIPAVESAGTEEDKER
jgi:C4-dicarboxylate-specific signal transduction histidine kinase